MKITNEQYNIVLEWVKKYFIKRQSINYDMCAYTIHGIFERLYDRGFYVDEFVIVDAMKDCGYDSIYRDGQYYFNISKRSEALQIYYSSLGYPPKASKPEWS